MAEEMRENFMMENLSFFDLVGVSQVRVQNSEIILTFEFCIYPTRGILKESGGLSLWQRAFGKRKPYGGLVVYIY